MSWLGHICVLSCARYFPCESGWKTFGRELLLLLFTFVSMYNNPMKKHVIHEHIYFTEFSHFSLLFVFFRNSRALGKHWCAVRVAKFFVSHD